MNKNIFWVGCILLLLLGACSPQGAGDDCKVIVYSNPSKNLELSLYISRVADITLKEKVDDEWMLTTDGGYVRIEDLQFCGKSPK